MENITEGAVLGTTAEINTGISTQEGNGPKTAKLNYDELLQRYEGAVSEAMNSRDPNDMARILAKIHELIGNPDLSQEVRDGLNSLAYTLLHDGLHGAAPFSEELQADEHFMSEQPQDHSTDFAAAGA